MSQASFDDLEASGEFESDIFGSELGADGADSVSGFGSEIGFEEAGNDFTEADTGAPEGDGFEQAGASAPLPVTFRKQGFSVYTLMLVLSFLMLTATAIIMFSYAESL